MNVEDLLRTAVNDAVKEVPPGFADGAMRQARRQRRTAGAAAASGVAVFALAAAAVAVDPTDLRTDPAPAGGPGGGVVELDGLAAGAPPQVPWYEDGALHFSATSTPADVSWDDEADDPIIRRIRDGYVVWTWESDGAYGRSKLTLVHDDGEQVVLADGDVTPPAVSPDGERIAWGVPNREWVLDEEAREDGLTSVVMVADAAGEVVAELPDAPSPKALPKGIWEDGRVVIEAGANEAWGVHLWEPGGAVTPVRSDVGIDAASAGNLAVLTGAGGAEVTDLVTGAVLRPFHDGGEPRFSADSQYLASISRPGEFEDPDELVIRDNLSGEEVLRVAFRAVHGLAWETPTTVVVDAYDDTGAALVRCAVGGDCELATEQRPVDDDPATFDSPYVLGRG